MVQVVMGLRRMKGKTLTWRLMERYEAMKKGKGSGKAIVATARKMATVIWNMLTEEVEFDLVKMVDRKLAKKAEAMSGTLRVVKEALIEREEKPVVVVNEKKDEGVEKKAKKTGVARKTTKRKKKVG